MAHGYVSSVYATEVEPNIIVFSDILKRNIMMDARPVDPDDTWGWYFLTHLPEGAHVQDADRFVRAQGPVKYYYIDFDLAVACADGEPVLPLSNNRTLDVVPEVTEDRSTPFDPFKADVYLLGCVFRDLFFTVRAIFHPYVLAADHSRA